MNFNSIPEQADQPSAEAEKIQSPPSSPAKPNQQAQEFQQVVENPLFPGGFHFFPQMSGFPPLFPGQAAGHPPGLPAPAHFAQDLIQ